MTYINDQGRWGWMLATGVLAALLVSAAGAQDRPADRAEQPDQPAAAEVEQDGDEPGADFDRPRRPGQRLRDAWPHRRDRPVEADGERARGDLPMRHRPMYPPAKLDDEQVNAALDVLGDINPKLRQRIAHAMDDHPERARMMLGRMWPRLERLVDLRQTDRDAYDLHVSEHRSKFQTLRLVAQLRQAQRDEDEAAQQKLTSDLRRHMEEHFEIRQKLREQELARLEKRIAAMREQLAEHRRRKGELIDTAVHAGSEGRRLPQPDDGAPGDTTE